MSQTADSVTEVVEEYREEIELVAEGDDEPAEWARAWLQEAGDDD